MSHSHTPLKIQSPISVSEYMRLCLGDDENGYYQKQNPFGAHGDFITAPELTPLFCETIGIWVLHRLQILQPNGTLHIVEFGAGTGILMSDVVRVIAKIQPTLIHNVQLHIVETSHRLRAIQAQTLNAYTAQLHWHTDASQLPVGHCIFIANEFFDALPIHQYEYRNGKWHERLIGPNAFGELEWQLEPCDQPNYPFQIQSTMEYEGSIIESCPEAKPIIDAICQRLATAKGAALIIDYGYLGPANGDTFQAIQKHTYTDPLKHLGEADLTAHVDFGALIFWAQAAQRECLPLIDQSEFLQSMGILTRFHQVYPTLTQAQQPILTSAIERLIAPDQMGTLFKVLQIL